MSKAAAAARSRFFLLLHRHKLRPQKDIEKWLQKSDNRLTYFFFFLKSRLFPAHPDSQWRKKIALFIESHQVQVPLMVILMCDVVLVVAEVVLGTCMHLSPGALLPLSDVCRVTLRTLGRKRNSKRSEDCRRGFISSHCHWCTHSLVQVLLWMSVGILFLFALESLLLMFAYLQRWFRKPLYVTVGP